jgi:colanic acid/amylovoran biosynthesis glycosyltransferase
MQSIYFEPLYVLGHGEAMTRLLVISSAPVLMDEGKAFLDTKFVEGMTFYNDCWEGPVSCLLKQGTTSIPFGRSYEVDQLPFDLTVLRSNKMIGAEEIADCDVVLCSGDNHDFLHISGICHSAQKKIAFIIEYIQETRKQIIFLDPAKRFAKKLYSLAWTGFQEIRRRRAFRRADGLQANGYPAASTYRPLNSNTVMYLDNRIGEKLLATEGEMEARRQRLLSGAPIRLIHSGRLEHLKGSHDLIPIAQRLRSSGVDFTLDIFGAGSLEGEIRRDIEAYGLKGLVRMNGTVDFEKELVPFARQYADIYLSCHRQSDPSCTYVENMGCGLAVIGYDNRMLSALSRDSTAGLTVPLGNSKALAVAIIEISKDRARLVKLCDNARAFAGTHTFEKEFMRRIVHLRNLAQQHP